MTGQVAAHQARRLFVLAGMRVAAQGFEWADTGQVVLRDRETLEVYLFSDRDRASALYPDARVVEAYDECEERVRRRVVLARGMRKSRMPQKAMNALKSIPDERSLDPRLTDRQWQVVSLLAQGKTTADVGGMLGITESSVKGHIFHSQHQLGIRGRTPLVLWVIETRQKMRQWE